MRRNLVLIAVFFLFLLFLSSSCAPGSGRYSYKKQAGFFTGVWHGWIAPITLIIGIFNPAMRVYETANAGWWYDFGFYIAVISGFGSLSLTRKRKKTKN